MSLWTRLDIWMLFTVQAIHAWDLTFLTIHTFNTDCIYALMYSTESRTLLTPPCNIC